MICTLATLAACFSLSGFYVDTAVSLQDSGVEQYAFYRNTPGRFNFDREALNPYVRFTLGYDVQLWRRCSGYAEASHVSSAATSRDRGVNSLLVGVRCRPFGGTR